jgi:hypothetical protein
MLGYCSPLRIPTAGNQRAYRIRKVVNSYMEDAIGLRIEG